MNKVSIKLELLLWFNDEVTGVRKSKTFASETNREEFITHLHDNANYSRVDNEL